MPLIIIDYIRDDFKIRHNGYLRRFVLEGLKYAEGQVLEVYEGWQGKERVRVVNLRITSIFDHKYIYLPREEMLKHGVPPKTWIVTSVNRVGDPKRDLYYPVYPGRLVSYVPPRDVVIARLEDLMVRSTGLASFIAGLIIRMSDVVKDVERLKKEFRV